MLLVDDLWISDNSRKFYKKKIVVITGAGISVACGIPDFRSKKGIFSEIKKKYKVDGADLFSYRFSLDPRTRPIYLEYISRLKRLVDRSKPSFSHSFFKYLLGVSKGLRVYSQNIDGLEERAGLPFSEDSKTNLVYLHGHLKALRCISCGKEEEFSQEHTLAFERGCEVECQACSSKGRIKYFLHTSIIHYYQDHPSSDLISSCIRGDTGCNLLIVVGTRLDVFGVKNMVKYFKRTSRSIKIIFVNPEPPKKSIESLFDFHYPGKSDDFFKTLKKNLEEYRMSRRIKRLSIQKDDENKENRTALPNDQRCKISNDHRTTMCDNSPTISEKHLKRLSLTTEEIHSSFLNLESKNYSPMPKKRDTSK